MNLVVDINVFNFMCHRTYHHHKKANELGLLSLTVEKDGNVFQVIHKGGSVCIIKMAVQEIVCCGFGINTTGTKWI